MNTTSRRNFLKETALITGGLATFGLSLIPHKLFSSISSLNLPYYKIGTPNKTDLRNETGNPFVLQGKVFQNDGIMPLANAVVEIWQCNARGHYDYSQQFSYRGKTITDTQGNYSFKTHFPGKYKENGINKMSRIFVLVQGQGYEESFSQLYFDSNQNPFIDNKHWESAPVAEMPTLPRLLNKLSDKVVIYNLYLNRSTLLYSLNEKEMALSQWRLYPTHASHHVFLTFGKNKPGNINIRLINGQGKQVQQQFLKEADTNEPVKIDISQLPAGNYTCTLYSSKIGKIIKQLKVV